MAEIGHNSAAYGQEMTDSAAAREFWQFIDYIRCSGLPAPVRHVAIEIWLHMRPWKMNANPSAKRIADFTGLSERTVRTAFGALAKAPFFSVSKPQKGRGNTRTFRAVSFQTMTELGNALDDQALRNIPRNDDAEGARIAVFQPKKPASPAPLSIVKPAPAAVNEYEKPAPAAVLDEKTCSSFQENLQELHPKLPNRSYQGKNADAPARAATPVEVAECWKTPKAIMAAGMNADEARSQRHVWVSPLGSVEISQEMRDEMTKTFPLVDHASALAAAAPNVRPEKGAVTCLANVRRQYGYMQQDAAGRERRANARSGPAQGQSTKLLDDSDRPKTKPRPREEVEA
jgi:hypothetical protein